MRPGFNGEILDASAGPVGSPEWIKSRAERFEGNGELSPEETERIERFAADFNAAVAVTKPGFVGPIMPAMIGEKESPAPRVNRAIVPGYEIALVDGKIRSVGDADETPFCAVDDTEKVRRRIEAERIYHAICSDECGIVVDPELLAKKTEEKAALRAQSHAIGRKLETAGETAYRSGEWCLWVYGIHSGEVEIVPQFRRVAFIPYVAAQIREPFVRALEYYLQRRLWCRFWTLTGGNRVPLDDFEENGRTFLGVRKAISHLNRRISRLNHEDFMKAAGVRIVFRSDELGTIERGRKYTDTEAKKQFAALVDEAGEIAGRIERDENGRLWFHPHAHCVVDLEKGRLSKAEWSAFMTRLRAYWVDWMDDSGVIRNVREAVKYVTKPGEIQHLTPEETKALFAALRRMKLVQPLGALAAEMKAREEAGRTLIRQRTDDGFVWVEIDNWNRREPTSDEKFPVSVRVGEDAEGEDIEITAALSERDMIAATKLSSSDADVCVVVARCTPSASSLGIKEPRVVVMGKRWNLQAVLAHPLVDRLWMQTHDAWQAGLQLIRVHTGTPTVRRKPAFDFMPDIPERAAPPGEPVFR